MKWMTQPSQNSTSLSSKEKTIPDTAVMKPYWQHSSKFSIHDGCIHWGMPVVIFSPWLIKNPQRTLCRSSKSVTDEVTGSQFYLVARNQPRGGGNSQTLTSANVHATHLLQLLYNHGNGLNTHCLDYTMMPSLWGHTFLVTVDVHSKWMDIKAMKCATSSATIKHLRSLFANHGLQSCWSLTMDPASQANSLLWRMEFVTLLLLLITQQWTV